MQERQHGSTLVAAFHERAAAEHAVRDLEAAGFHDDQVGFMARGTTDGAGTTEAAAGTTVERDHGAGLLAGASRGSLTGGAVGGILGAIAALAIPGIGPILAGGVLAGVVGGAIAGGTLGGVTGALRGLDVPEKEARYYEGEFGRGRTLVTVRPGQREAEAIEILRRHGGYDATTGDTQAAAAEPMAVGAGAGAAGDRRAVAEEQQREQAVADERAQGGVDERTAAAQQRLDDRSASENWDPDRHRLETERMKAENERARLELERQRLEQERRS